MPGVEASRDATEAEELAKRLADIDALRRRVLNVIPHALRTPITTFRGLTEALDFASDTEIREEIGPALRRLAMQAERLLDDMLLAAGITTTLPTADAGPTPVVETARRVWADVGGKGRLDICAPDGGDVLVLAPSGTLERILGHVLDNASKYGDDPTELRVERAGSRVHVVVDSPGEPVVDVALLSEPFWRSERAVMLAAGLGVGLTVAQALAEHAGGRLDVCERQGGGVVVTLDLEGG